MAEENSLLLLDQFIAAASYLNAEDKSCIKLNRITAQNEDNVFLEKISNFEKGIKDNSSNTRSDKATTTSIIHSGETDSSEDEDQRDFELRKYNEFGRDIRRLLVDSGSKTSTEFGRLSWKPRVRKGVENKNDKLGLKETKVKPKPAIETNIYTDPIFGLRIVNPLISSITLQDRMKGRTAVPLSRMKQHVVKLNPNDDWVFAGAIVSKIVKTSQKGSQFSIWTISDMHNDLKTVALFLFSGAHKNLWKTIQGTVVGVLNPTVMEQKEKCSDEATFSVNNSDRIMVMGRSKDLGTCRSQKKSGDPCTSFVNKNRCEYCIYHVKAEYQKFSGRSDLQSPFLGGDPNALRNKVLGKNEVFYAGKSFTAVKAPSRRSAQKLRIKDDGTLKALSSGIRVNTDVVVRAKNLNKGAANKVDTSVAQRRKDLELLQKLCGTPKLIAEAPNTSGKRISRAPGANNPTKSTSQNDVKFDLFSGRIEAKKDFDGTVSSTVSLTESKNTALSVIAKLKAKKVAENQGDDLTSINEAQYEGTSDLFSSEIDYKPNLDTTISNCVTPTESKYSALDVNAILKSKKATETAPKQAVLYGSKAKKPDSNLIDTLFADNENIGVLNYDSNDFNSEKTKAVAESFKQKVSNATGRLQESTMKMQKSMNDVTLTTTHVSMPQEPKKLKTPNRNINLSNSKSNLPFDIPLLSGYSGKSVDLNAPVSKSLVNRAKLNAITYVQRHGAISKVDPMNVKGTKRKAEHSDLSSPATKKLKQIQENEFMTQRFKKIMAATSKHPELLQKIDDEEQDKYFHKMEIKEKMEEKMLETFKVNCKGVKCLKCKYTSFSASDRCKAEKHPLKVYDAVKRFFKCSNCGNRTVCLTVVPVQCCQKCSGGKWERCAMIAERKAKTLTQLSIRGGEERYVGGSVANANINLMVPEEGT